MKKKKNTDEFIEKLEEAVEKMLDEIENSEENPISVDVSINVCPMVCNPEVIYAEQEGRTPVDILETENNIHVVVGLPGMDDIKVDCSGWELEITATNAEKTLEEVIELPARANKTGMKSTYKNGILELVFNKSKRVKKQS